MKNLLGEEIPDTTRAVLYICEFSHKPLKIKPIKCLMFEDQYDGVVAFSEIPNPESQLARGNTYKDLCGELESLHKNMSNKVWLKQLSECI